MKNKIILMVIILIGFVLNIFSQQTFRKMIYLNQSIGGHIYYEGVITNVPAEVDSYNVKYGLTGEDEVSITKYPDDDYPPNGNQMWKWKAAFYDETNIWADPPEPYDFKEEFLDDTTYSVIMVKFCASSQSAIWFYWYEGPQDTINYPQTQSYYNYQWYIRKIVRKMEEYPEKYFVMWNVPSGVESMGTVDDMARLALFNQWMTDSLAMGLDAQIGDFPANIYVFDYFNLLKSPYSNYMDSLYRDTPDDYHPNAAASEVVAPKLVEQSFNAAINYESAIPVELTSFSASILPIGIELNWSTATELNNDMFEIQKKTDSSDFIAIGVVKGQGTSTEQNNYSFLDKIKNSGRYLYRLKQIDFNGNYEYSKVVEVGFITITTYSLDQNYPNPFNPSTTIRYNLPEAGNVRLTIYDVLGQEIRTLVNEYKEPGIYAISFDASELDSGMYIYKLEANGFIQTRKMTLVK